MLQQLSRYAMIALSIVGSATLLFSCSKESSRTKFDYETLLTDSSENRTITMMENGRRSYTFVTPLMEGYSMATNPYQEFRRGIDMTTYTNDSLNLVDANIRANYAIYYENQKLWEAKGNVIIIKNNRKDGDTTVTDQTEIYTQQLFWNATTKKIYSNVDTKILQPDGWHFGVGFDADEDLKNIHFRKYSSEMEFDMSQPTEEELEAERKKNEERDNKGAKSDKNSSKGAKGVMDAKDGKSNQNAIKRDNSAPNSRNKTLQNNTAKQPSTQPKNHGSISPQTPTQPKGGSNRLAPKSDDKRPNAPANKRGEVPRSALQTGTSDLRLNTELNTTTATQL